MKHFSFTISIAGALLASCTFQEVDTQEASAEETVFFASFEQPGDKATKVYADDNLMVLWDADDRVSIFNKNTANLEYRFTGKTGDNAGSFRKVGGANGGSSLELVYSVYPYMEENSIDKNGALSLTLPATQTYREDSFGIGANTMVSCTTGNQLLFKNVCGYLMLRLYGDNVTIKSISIKGNNNEPLAGTATVKASVNTTPTLSFGSDASKEIMLIFDSPVKIGATENRATTFWLVVPPIAFSQGFTLTVEDTQNKVFEKVTANSFEVERNSLVRMSALKVVPVTPPVAVENISLDSSELTLAIGKTKALVATVLPEDATNKAVTWSTSDPSVATVDAEGKVTALAVGSTTITASAGGKKDACAVTVIEREDARISVSPTEINVPYDGGATTIIVETNVEISVKVPADAKWISVSKENVTTGSEQESYSVTVPNNNSEKREAIITFSGSGIEKEVLVSQRGYPVILSKTAVTADCLDGSTVSVDLIADDTWTVKEVGSSILSLSTESGDAGKYTITATLVGANCTNTDRVASLMFECKGISKTLEIKQVPAFRFDTLDHVIPATGGSYKFLFHFPREFKYETVHTLDYDNGFYNLLYKNGEDNAPNLILLNNEASDANPVDTYMYMSYSFKPNYGSNARTGRFKLYFDDDGQRLTSEWVNVTQLPDENAGDEDDGVSTVLQEHSKGSGIPIVILGDGFTKDDIKGGLFNQAAEEAFGYFFSVEPLTSLKEYFDVWSITAVSSSHSFNGSGTRFQSRITTGTHIVGNDDLAYRYASKVVPSDKAKDVLIIVVMNTTRYAGTCYMYSSYRNNKWVMSYAIAYTPMSNQYGMTFENVIHHEACGHGFGKLADEYTGNGTISSSESDNLLSLQRSGAYLNVDLNSQVESTLWAQYAADSRFDLEQLGAYEGAYTYDKGVYRPAKTSIMVTNKGIFNAPSRAQIYKRAMSIANNWNWEYDYEDFVTFDAPFRNAYYTNGLSTAAMTPYLNDQFEFIPLAPPVFVLDKE